MKYLPYSDCSLLTKEDSDIWGCRKWSRFSFKMADRRDADIMRIGVMNPWCLGTWQTGSPSDIVLLRGGKRAGRAGRVQVGV